MSSALGRSLKRRFAAPYACYKLVTTKRSFIRESGWIESIRTSKPCDRDGSPVPWMNYSMVELLRERLDKTHRLFEFGSGFSTCFYAEHCKSVTSVEYDRAWLELVRETIPENATIIYQSSDTDGDYCRTIRHQLDDFDVVVIDGRDRVNCITQSLYRLSDVGVLLLDDSDRAEYADSFDMLESAGFNRLCIAGLKPTSPCRHESTIFYRHGNCLGI
jgi:hypothetical protein